MIAAALAAFALLLTAVERGVAVTHLGRGARPPALALETLDGKRVTLEDQRGRPVVVVFGELYHQRTLSACGDIGEVLEADALATRGISVMLVIGQDEPKPALRERAGDPRLPPIILHDVTRQAFGDYRVAVMPSVVVIGADGRVVHSVAGYTDRFKDIMNDALLVATGASSYEEFEKTLRPEATPVDEARVRAGRITGLARQLARRRLDDLAVEKYREAIAVAPDYAPARIGLATAMLDTGRLAEAEREFRAALEASTSSVEASLGLAYVLTLRGGDDLKEAREIIRDLLRDDPDEPRAHYVRGLLHQQSGETEEAMASFRTSAELLMVRRDAWNVIREREERHGKP
ncbi:MAG: tetratricopeptide repeat protein [Planctomycetes bacterium]|nr:tetratricopeptide repeat protein [Planctomycetota bacterium]